MSSNNTKSSVMTGVAGTVCLLGGALAGFFLADPVKSLVDRQKKKGNDSPSPSGSTEQSTTAQPATCVPDSNNVGVGDTATTV